MVDFTRVRNKEITLSELAKDMSVDDLHRLTDEMVHEVESLISDAADRDVTFVPIDPDAKDTFAARPEDVNLAWTLGHVIVHATASSEEAAALSTDLARGVEIKGRSRYETPWQTVHTVEQLRSRLNESQRIRHSFLNAWPDQPNLILTFTASYPGATAVNAKGRFLQGLMHEDAHLGQIREIMRQARLARAA